MKKIAVFLGGKSMEKKVSKASGGAVINALRKNKNYKIFRCDPADTQNMKDFLSLVNAGEIDLVFNALHGTGAEDGEMQGFLKTLEIPFTGPQIHGAALAFDKISTKRILRAEGISVCEEISFEKINKNSSVQWRISGLGEEKFSTEISTEILKSWASKISYPAFAKAAREGSSYGIYQLKSPQDFIKILGEMTQKYSRILVEPKLTGTEVTCSVVNGQAMEMIEIVAEKGDFYDYESKYEEGGSSHYLPPRKISITAKEKFQKVSEKIGFLLDLDCPYRVDGFIDGENFWIMEINTLPGMTGTSLLPEAYTYSTKKSFAEMCEGLVLQALK